jgi:hypothetical protein
MPLLGLKERLLEAAGMDSGMMDYCKEHDSKKPSSSNSHGRSRVVHHHNDKKKKTARSGLTEDEIGTQTLQLELPHIHFQHG